MNRQIVHSMLSRLKGKVDERELNEILSALPPMDDPLSSKFVEHLERLMHERNFVNETLLKKVDLIATIGKALLEEFKIGDDEKKLLNEISWKEKAPSILSAAKSFSDYIKKEEEKGHKENYADKFIGIVGRNYKRCLSVLEAYMEDHPERIGQEVVINLCASFLSKNNSSRRKLLLLTNQSNLNPLETFNIISKSFK